MGAVLVLAMLLPLAAGLAALLQCRMEESIALSFFGLVCVGYACALAGLLPVLAPVLWALNAAGGALAVRAFLVKKSAPLSSLVPGTAAFLLLAALGWWLCRGVAFSSWDDFSHWGKVVRYMFYTGQMYTAPGSTDGFKTYPPATALLQYMFLTGARRGWREDLVLYVNALLTGAMVLVPLRAVSGRRRLGALAALAFALLCPMLIYPTYFYRVSVDGLLGVLAAGLLAAHFAPGRTRATPWLETLGCFALALVKSSGAGLAAALALTFFVTRGAQTAGPGGRHASVHALDPLAATLLALGSWKVYLALLHISPRWKSSGGALQNLWQLASGGAPAYRYEVLQSFARTVFSTPNYGALVRFPFIVWPFVTLAAAGAGALAKRAGAARMAGAPKGARPGADAGAVGAGESATDAGAARSVSLWPPVLAALAVTAAFTLSLLYAYLFLFSASEAAELASVYRYLDTCTVLLALTGLYALCAGALCGAVRAPARAVLALLAGACACGALFDLPACARALQTAPLWAAQTNTDRTLPRRAAQHIRTLGEDAARVYIVTANDAGSAQFWIDFELIPIELPENNAILKAPEQADEPWVRGITAADWGADLAAHYGYVYLYTADTFFLQEYSGLFEDAAQIADDSLYRVVPQPDGSVLLRYMAP